MSAKQNDLFPELNGARYGESRSHERLFLPREFRNDAEDYRLRDEAQRNAHEIVRKWADIEASGRLQRKKETTLHGEFLADVFGNALGYTFFSEGRTSWEIEAEFGVNGGTADAAIGHFGEGRGRVPRAVIELKGPKVNLDRDRFNGRTAVQQLWDYLYALPGCPWGIVSNYVSFRLYHRDRTPRAFELFTLQELRDEQRFRQFYYLFQREGLLPKTAGQTPRADLLLEKTSARQREVGDELYEKYHAQREALIRHLARPPHNRTLDEAIHIVQKLLDRIIFVAFCEDRALLPEKSIKRAHATLSPFYRVTNPRWRNFLDLFHHIDEGSREHGIPAYDGRLFRPDAEVDDLQLDDEWTDFFVEVGDYDFSAEVNVDVLGHLFERSVNDIERFRLSGLYGQELRDRAKPKMTKSAERKRGGVYYTPPEFTEFIAENTIGALLRERFADLAREHGIDPDAHPAKPDAAQSRYWQACLAALRDTKILDPACGSGAFLIRAYDLLLGWYRDVTDHVAFHAARDPGQLRARIPQWILHENLHGVDLSREAVEITQLALWIRSADQEKTLEDLSANIVRGNSLVSDPEADESALDWAAAFPAVFDRPAGGFDCIIGNPPWERMKLQEREFFDAVCPEIASAVSAAQRRTMVRDLESERPELHRRYAEARDAADRTLAHVRDCGRYPLTGKGDVNTYAVFSELAARLISPRGRVGLLVPSGIATDFTARDFFARLVDEDRLAGLYDFENKAPAFPDVHRSFKFSVLLFGGAERRFDAADFVFFAHRMDDLRERGRHIELTADDLKLLNPNSRTCPIFRSPRDAELTRDIYRRVPVLVDRGRKRGGNPWGVRFLRMFDQTNDAERFTTAEELKRKRYRPEGNVWVKGGKRYLPLYEAKMVQAYDHRAAGVVVNADNWMRQGQTRPTTLVEHQNPEFVPTPRWWCAEEAVEEAMGGGLPDHYLAYKDVTSATNVRTMIAAFLPPSGVMNSAPLVCVGDAVDRQLECCLLANLNSFVLDFVARQKVGGVHLNFFIVEQLPIFPPAFYAKRCPWDRRQTLRKWVSDRVLKLTCTSEDMRPLAEAAGMDPPIHPWDPDERDQLTAELDAAYFLLYGLERDDVEYVLGTFSGADQAAGGIFAHGSAAERVMVCYDILRERSAAAG